MQYRLLQAIGLRWPNAIDNCKSLWQSLVNERQGALGQSRHSLGLSCASPVLAWSQAELAFERPREIREIVEADGVGDLLGQCA